MAKGQKRGNREQKKPKQAKKVSKPAAPFIVTPPRTNGAVAPKKG